MDGMTDSDDDIYSESDNEVFLSDGEPCDETSAPPMCRYTIIDATQLGKEQEEALSRVVNVMACSTAAARSLLIHFRWDTDTLFGKYADRGAEWMFRVAGVAQPRQPEASSSATQEGEVACATCLCDVPVEDATRMECGHWFCNECWSQHMRIQILDGRSRRLLCMAFQCGTVCDEDKVKSLIADDPEVLERYERSLLESYIEDNSQVQWCPSVPHCGRAIRVDGDQYCEPECSCSMKFCFACSNEPHSPCTCNMWKTWLQKCEDDSETKNWLQANTKPCPKCSKPVEKNGGCNLVTCLCSQSFCWLCGASTGREHTWTQISNHSCGRYKEELDRKIDEAARNVKRYVHYHTRWDAHMKSRKLELALRAKLVEKISVLEDSQSQLKDYSWLLQALEQVCNARRILGYSYVFAYFMFGNDMFKDEISYEQNEINQGLFEDQQQQLESEVERLSGLIGTDTDKMQEAEHDMRLAVINSTVNVDKRLERLYELIENDLLGTITDQSVYIAPYKGQSLLRATRALPEQKSSGVDTPPVPPMSEAEYVDLTNDSPSPPAARLPMTGEPKRRRIAALGLR